jgi:hypothetical protein
MKLKLSQLKDFQCKIQSQFIQTKNVLLIQDSDSDC